MSVKRYSVNLSVNRSVEVNESLHGSLVKYHDYAELEQKLIESERYGRQTDITIENLEMKLAQMAAENAGLKGDVPLGAIENGRAFADRLEAYPFECQGGNLNMCSDWQELRRCFEHLSEWAMHGQPETPTTDAFLAEVRAQARYEGINYAASRLAAAFNHGFVDKPLAEVFDVVRMILDTKEELANSTLPAVDGLSGEYAQEFIENFTVELRKGVQS